MSGLLMLDGFILASDVAIFGSFAAVLSKLTVSKSSAGLSLQSLVALVGARCLHLCSHGFRLHYTPQFLPWTAFALLDVINAVAGLACLVLMGRRFYKSYDAEKDNFGIQLFDRLGWVPTSVSAWHRSLLASSLLYVFVAVLAFMWYNVRQGTTSFGQGYFICFYEVLFGVALLPQLWMFHHEKRVPPIMAWFVVMIAIGRICVLSFWVTFPLVHIWHVPTNRGIQMGTEILNLVILSDFVFHWAKARLNGQKDVVLPF
jgi:hypothetical protein